MSDNTNPLKPHPSAGLPGPKHRPTYQSFIGAAVAVAAMLSLSLIGINTASAAAPAGGHSSHASSQGGGDGGT